MTFVLQAALEKLVGCSKASANAPLEAAIEAITARQQPSFRFDVASTVAEAARQGQQQAVLALLAYAATHYTLQDCHPVGHTSTSRHLMFAVALPVLLEKYPGIAFKFLDESMQPVFVREAHLPLEMADKYDFQPLVAKAHHAEKLKHDSESETGSLMQAVCLWPGLTNRAWLLKLLQDPKLQDPKWFRTEAVKYAVKGMHI